MNMKPGPLLLVGAVFLLIVILGWWLGIPKVVPNSEFYIQVATGHGESVVRPFSTRVLHPWLARALIRSGLGVGAAFAAVSVFAMALLLLSVVFTVRWLGGERTIWPVILFCPLLLEYFRAAYMPDLFHAALLGVLFLALLRAELLVPPILVALYLCRESTVLVALVLVLYFAWRRKYGYAAGAVIATVLGMVVVGLFAPAGSQNIHHFSTGSYIALKSVWNFLSNWLGLRLWQPTFALQPTSPWGCPNPLLTLRLPGVSSPLVVCDWHP